MHLLYYMRLYYYIILYALCFYYIICIMFLLYITDGFDSRIFFFYLSYLNKLINILIIRRVRVEYYVNENTLKERLHLYFVKNQQSSEP